MKNYIIKILNGMAMGLFSSLLIGLILKQVGTLINWDLLVTFGKIAQLLAAPAIGAGIAHAIGAPGLVIFSSMVSAIMGAGAIKFIGADPIITTGEPVGAMVAALISSEVGRRLAGKTKFDIIILPASVIIIGGMVGKYASPYIATAINEVGQILNFATQQEPFLMGIIISLVMGILLTLPTSSAAIGISFKLSGLAAGASVAGCAAHMVGFAVASFEDNGFSGLISQGLGTSMLQIPNIVKKPIIMLPPILTSIIVGPLSTILFKMQATPEGSGMGTSGLVGQFSTYALMGKSGILGIIILHFLLPAILSYIFTKFMKRHGWIKKGDMKLNIIK